MNEKLEKIMEIKVNLTVKLEKAETLLKICENEISSEEINKIDLHIISRITLKIVQSGAKMVSDLEKLLLVEKL